MQTEFYAELGEGADRLEIPWASPTDPANRFYDLKAEPALLDSIVEARARPALRSFLQGVNAPETLFVTAKCDTWTTAEFTPAEQAAFPAARMKFAGYIDLVFARDPFGKLRVALSESKGDPFNFHRHHFEQLARRLRERLAAEPAAARAEFCLRHCYYRAREAWGFYLTVFLYGYGPDPAEAERHWAAGLAALGRALVELSGLLQQALRQAQAAEQA